MVPGYKCYSTPYLDCIVTDTIFIRNGRHKYSISQHDLGNYVICKDVLCYDKRISWIHSIDRKPNLNGI